MLVYDQYIYPEKPDIDDDIVVFHSGFCSTSPNYSYGKDTRDYYLIHFVTRRRYLPGRAAHLPSVRKRWFFNHSRHHNRTYGG